MRRRQFIGLVGAVAAMPVLRPLAVSAQQAGKPHRIAYLALLSGENATFAKPLLQRLEELGYHEGKNMIWDYHSAEGVVERLPQLAAEIVGTGPDVLITGFGTLAPKAAMAATRSIPIVFTSVGDPVGAGLVASLGQPGGNVTGMSGQASDIAAKKLQLLDDLIPGKKLVAVLGNPDTPYTALALRQAKKAATAIGLPLEILEARTVDQIPAAIDQAISARAASLLVLEDPVLLSAIPQTTELAAKAPVARHLRAAGICAGRRIDFVRNGPGSVEPPGRGVCRPDSQGRVPRQPSGRAAHKIRTRHQPQDREGAGSGDSVRSVVACRRTDRIGGSLPPLAGSRRRRTVALDPGIIRSYAPASYSSTGAVRPFRS